MRLTIGLTAFFTPFVLVLAAVTLQTPTAPISTLIDNLSALIS